MSQRDDHIVERLEASDRLSKCGRELAALESEAGIAEQAAAAREGANFPLVVGDHPHGSPEYLKNTAAYRENERTLTDARLRRAYLSVEDAELRRKLVAKDAECSELRRSNFRIDLRQAEEQLSKAQRAGRFWWIWASAVGFGWAYVGSNLLGGMGTLIGVVASFLFARYLEDLAMHKRALVSKMAQQGVEEAQRDLQDILDEPPRFSTAEGAGVTVTPLEKGVT